MLEQGGATSFEELGRIEGLSERYIAGITNVAFLSPKVTRMILSGTQPASLDLAELLKQSRQGYYW
jgi:hypothetical protein